MSRSPFDNLVPDFVLKSVVTAAAFFSGWPIPFGKMLRVAQSGPSGMAHLVWIKEGCDVEAKQEGVPARGVSGAGAGAEREIKASARAASPFHPPSIVVIQR